MCIRDRFEGGTELPVAKAPLLLTTAPAAALLLIPAVLAPKTNGRGKTPPPISGIEDPVGEDAEEAPEEEEELIIRRGERTQDDTVGIEERSPASKPGVVIPKRDTLPVRRPVRAASRSARGGVGRSPGGLVLLVRREDCTRLAVAALGTAGGGAAGGFEKEEMIMIFRCT